MTGICRSLAAADIDRDGHMDLLAGNLGSNCDYQASDSTPMELYLADLDGKGNFDPIPLKGSSCTKQIIQRPAAKGRSKDSLPRFTFTRTCSCCLENVAVGGNSKRHFYPRGTICASERHYLRTSWPLCPFAVGSLPAEYGADQVGQEPPNGGNRDK